MYDINAKTYLFKFAKQDGKAFLLIESGAASEIGTLASLALLLPRAVLLPFLACSASFLTTYNGAPPHPPSVA